MHRGGVHVLTSEQEETIRLQGLIYETSSHVPKSVLLYTHHNKHSQEARPDFYHTMSNASTQAYIHNAVVVVHHSNKKDKFVVFIKHHQYLPANLAVAKLRDCRSQEPVWRGDVVVMKKSVYSDKLVNLVSKKDRALANFVVKR